MTSTCQGKSSIKQPYYQMKRSLLGILGDQISVRPGDKKLKRKGSGLGHLSVCASSFFCPLGAYYSWVLNLNTLKTKNY